jgi:hypothetical protein
MIAAVYKPEGPIKKFSCSWGYNLIFKEWIDLNGRYLDSTRLPPG